jgi:hypothetical protein
LVLADWREFVSAGAAKRSQLQELGLARGLRCRVKCLLKVRHTSNGEVVLAVSGRLRAADLGELAALIDVERLGRSVVLDLAELVLADGDAIRFLCACERDGIELRNCRSYIRTWITRERTSL